MEAKASGRELKDCHDCGVKPGTLHKPGCDVERCPYCGGQLISCSCLGGRKKAAWIDKNLLPWTGIWPGVAEATEMGLWCRWGAPSGPWILCDKDHPDATADLNRLVVVAKWDRKAKRFVWRGRRPGKAKEAKEAK